MKYTTQWHTWWITLQLAWRGAVWPLKRTPGQTEGWDDIAKGGKNGFLIILLSLSWWVLKAEGDVEKREGESVIEETLGEWPMQSTAVRFQLL